MTEDLDKNEIFVVKASKSAVIDIACTKTVAREKWYSNFKTSLPNDYVAQIESFPSKTVFKFGDGKKVKSKCNTVLLSKSSLKKVQSVIHLDNNKATIPGKEINLHQSTSGHYCIDISPSSDCSNIEETMYLEKDLSNEQLKAQVTKIQKQFRHASTKNMNKLINNAGLFDMQTGKTIIDK